MPIPLESGHNAEALVFFAVNGLVRGNPPTQFVVIKLKRLRAAARMLALLEKPFSSGKIGVVNMQQVHDASTLDGILVEIRNTLESLCHPVGEELEEELAKKLGLGEEGEEKPEKLFVKNLKTKKTRRYRIVCPDDEEVDKDDEEEEEEEDDDEELTKKPRCDEDGIRNLRAISLSLADSDMEREAVRKMQSEADMVLHCLLQLQREAIPRALSEIQKRRAEAVVLPHPLTPRPLLL